MVIKANRVAEFDHTAARLLAHKDIYQLIEKKTGVPWTLIALTHLRESNNDFGTYLGNGQSLKRKTTIVPKRRGPFLGPNAFVDGAIDALKIDGLSSVRDWRLEKELYELEIVNGTGYDGRGLPSPYLWGGTNIQRAGKYTADHVFNAGVWDTQPGCAPTLARLAVLDHSIRWVRET